MKSIYYAHHILKYGTAIEAHEIDLIKDNFPDAEIINPSIDIEQLKEGRTVENIMEDCFFRIRTCDSLVFSTLSGVIGRGVFAEIAFAESLDKDVYEIIDGKLVQSYCGCNIKTLDASNNKFYAIAHAT